ncbi:hypothetical protein [Sulfurimonas sp.]|uniref:hypothetical protein n=1 Tax=Sulfurimonas sp. TaxID=2022749 RepID=UPI0025D12FBB|nr:hypothetical protein [Sulfurimonas sp.]MCK9455196.1 hypothetical protein [Sulfurimonas sp.]
MKTLKLFIAAFFLLSTSLLANYQSIYIPDQVMKDFSEQKYDKYRTETIPTLSLAELKSKGIYGENATLTKDISSSEPSFNDILNAGICKVDNIAKFSSTIYELDLPNGIITCMFAAKGDLYNPMGLYKVSVPKIKTFYQIDTKAATQEQAAAIATAEAQFLPLLQKKQEIINDMQEQANASYLTIPELLMAAVLTDDEIIDIEATKATGKFQLKEGFTSKFTESDEVVDNSEYLLADAATIFEVYGGLGTVSMSFLMIMVVGFGAYGGIRLIGSKAANKIDGNKGEGSTPWVVGLAAGVLLFFPVDQTEIQNAQGQVGEYELLKTRYQGFEKFGYYTFGNWGKESAKVIIDAEIDALIRKSGLGTKEQIVNTWAQKVQSDRPHDFYTLNYNYCKDTVYHESALLHSDRKSVYSETDGRLFPSTEHWAYASMIGRSMTDGFYEMGESGLIKDGITTEGYYPKFAFSACGKSEYLSDYHKDRKEAFSKSFAVLVNNDPTTNAKITALGDIFEFQYKLYRDWGYLAILGLPVTKMQTEYIGGLTQKNSEVLEKLNKKIKQDNKEIHSILSSLPYLMVPGMGKVFDMIQANSVVVGAASGAAIGSQAADGWGSWFYGLVGAIDGAAIGSTGPGGALIATGYAYMAAKILLSLAPIVAIVAIGLLRFIIIILKIFSFHFLSLFIMPIMFLQRNLEAFAKFTAKILATMLELPIFVLAIWLAVTANSLIHTIGTVFSKNIVGGMIDNSMSQNQIGANIDIAGYNMNSLFDKLILYMFDGFMEIVIAAFSIVIVYKLIISLHTELFQMIDLSSTSAIDNAAESIRHESVSWGSRI